ncbi:MAG TPA: MGMT family protein [Candidatus Binatia bacterium]|nr:MGMT family protein [Candidatus Binatia bacterium]
MKRPARLPGSDRNDKYARIYAVVRRIPKGRVATYGQVASLAGLPRQARLAGYALHALGDGPVPWHRVVGAGGLLALGRKRPDAAVTQRLRLEHEGVRFDGRGRVDMRAYAWSGARGRAAGR